ncbi:hypothetical protein N7E02_23335 [Aliirhizobium terrae]|uniref:DUF6625 family protein n=1 Tax=Terrirhizobium terrae TaxID=2926709 RepID=UPI0025781D34|nr:DUF6625 family protein [Rhizobium sp. CC-CFT758]WJH39667.1 hypothetical protein N7E02_23335 [Rhizobium sp. CC-CFT758]
MKAASYPRIIIFAVYFGRLPDYFALWLKSCSFNPEIEWRLVTDADISAYTLPANVSYRHTSLAEMTAQIGATANVELTVQSPYKVCDLRPLFWTLIEPDDGCDFWGHCDLDMIFGDLSEFLPVSLLGSYDKIFSVGHLTLYRNSPEANHFFEKPHPDLDFREILADPAHRGFDEHIGVNRIWLRHEGRFYTNEAIVADIDPHIMRFERSSNYFHFRNDRHQAFLFDRGKVKRLYWAGGALRSEDFIYVHFQKRKFALTSLPDDCDRFYITPNGFIAATDEAPGRAELDRLNGKPRLEKNEIRQRLRRWKRRALGLRKDKAA